MRNARWAGWGGAWLATAVWGLAGCASEVAPNDPAPIVAAPESTATVASAESHRTKDGDSTCSPLACCFPAQGGGWQDDPFQNRLQQLGCSTPAPYQQIKDTFWAWTECPFNLDVVAAVFNYSASPYSAHFVENLCLPIHLGKAQVVFDPLCVNCTASDQPPVITIPPVITLPPGTISTSINL